MSDDRICTHRVIKRQCRICEVEAERDQALQREQYRERDLDRILAAVGLTPEDGRTEGGWIRCDKIEDCIAKIRADLAKWQEMSRQDDEQIAALTAERDALVSGQSLLIACGDWDDGRLRVQSERAGVPYSGINTAQAMADAILALRAERDALRSEVDRLRLKCGESERLTWHRCGCIGQHFPGKGVGNE